MDVVIHDESLHYTMYEMNEDDFIKFQQRIVQRFDMTMSRIYMKMLYAYLFNLNISIQSRALFLIGNLSSSNKFIRKWTFNFIQLLHGGIPFLHWFRSNFFISRENRIQRKRKISRRLFLMIILTFFTFKL